MSIANKLQTFGTTLKSKLNAINVKLLGKGGTEAGTLDDVPERIEQLNTNGITPQGTLPISTNGTHNVYNYASVNVSVSGSSSLPEKTASNVTFNTTTKTVNVQAGQYSNAVEKEYPIDSTELLQTTATKNSLLAGATAYTVDANGNATSITGEIPTVSISNPTISLNNDSPKKIVATVTPSIGYVDSTTPISASILPSALDGNFIASNIKKDVPIFGITGSYQVPGGGTSLAEIGSNDISLLATYNTNNTNGAITITNGNADKQFSANNVIIKTVANLHPSNIKNGVSILGITGNYSASNSDNNYFIYPYAALITGGVTQSTIGFSFNFNQLTSQQQPIGVHLCSSDVSNSDTSCIKELFIVNENNNFIIYKRNGGQSKMSRVPSLYSTSAYYNLEIGTAGYIYVYNYSSGLSFKTSATYTGYLIISYNNN